MARQKVVSKDPQKNLDVITEFVDKVLPLVSVVRRALAQGCISDMEVHESMKLRIADIDDIVKD